MAVEMRAADLLQVALSRLIAGDEQAAELTARLAWRSGTPLVEIYEVLRSGVYGRTQNHDDPIVRDEWDQRLARLAARLSEHLDPAQPTCVLVLSSHRRGIPAALLHLFSERGMRAQEIDLELLSRHRHEHPGAELPYLSARYVVADVGADGGESLAAQLDLLTRLHLDDAGRDVIVLTDPVPAGTPAPSRTGFDSKTFSHVTALAEILRVTGAQNENPLTLREREVLNKVSTGATNPQVAHELGISIGTVKTYLERAQEKTQARDRASTVAVALRKGWL